MRGESKLINTLKATRINRILPILVLILIPAAKANEISTTTILLGTNVILIYAASSIYNAHKDNDYNLPKTFPIIMITLITLAILTALPSKAIMISSTLCIALGFIYNTIARFVVLGDAMALSFTHFAIPLATSSIISGIDPNITIAASSTAYFLGISIMPTTNLKDIKKDISINYKTLVNSTKNPEKIASYFLIFSLLIFSIIYILFCQNTHCLLTLIPTATLGIIIVKMTRTKTKPKIAMNLMRIYLITAYITLIINLTLNPKILISAFAISYTYILIMFTDYKPYKQP